MSIATHTHQHDEKHNLVSSDLDTVARDIETHEPAKMLVDKTSQSQVLASSLDGSEPVEKMERACNYMSNSDTVFSPVLNNELYGIDQVHWEWGGDESSNNIYYDNQTCNVSDFFNADLLIASLPFDESGNNGAFTDICPLPHYILPDQYMLLPYLEDGSTNTDFDPQLFIKNQPELSDVVFNYWPWNTPRKKAVTLALDLDETLIHSTRESCNPADFSFRVSCNKQENMFYYVKRRPHLYRFLERVVELFNVFIFTASHSIYASQILDILDPHGKFISRRLYRDSCIFLDGIYTKDLTVLGLDLAKVAIIDNCPQVYRLQKNNGIPIKTWLDDPNDDSLISMLPFLESLAVADDVRPLIGRRFGNMG